MHIIYITINIVEYPVNKLAKYLEVPSSALNWLKSIEISPLPSERHLVTRHAERWSNAKRSLWEYGTFGPINKHRYPRPISACLCSSQHSMFFYQHDQTYVVVWFWRVPDRWFAEALVDTNSCCFVNSCLFCPWDGQWWCRNLWLEPGVFEAISVCVGWAVRGQRTTEMQKWMARTSDCEGADKIPNWM